MLLQRFRHFVSCQGVTIKSVNYFINFHQISWPFASSSQALYVRTRSKVPSDSFASECNLSPGEAAKLLKLHFFSWKKMRERFNNAILQENKRKTRFKWWCSKKTLFLHVSLSFPFGWSSRQVSQENRIYSESLAIQRHSDHFWVDSYWFPSSNMPRMAQDAGKQRLHEQPRVWRWKYFSQRFSRQVHQRRGCSMDK